MRPVVGFVWLLLISSPSQMMGQAIRVGVHGVAVTHSEVTSALKANGLGVGGLLGLRVGRFGFEARGYWADLDSDRSDGTGFAILQVDGRAHFVVARSVAVEVGAGRRFIDPEFATQEIGIFRVGILSEYPLSSIATVWGRGAYLIASQFSGGGTAGLAVELGLGTSVGTPDGRVKALGEFEFQRFDREVRRQDVPLQAMVVRFGVEFGFR